MNIIFDRSRTFQHFEGIGASGAWWAQCVGGWNNKTENGTPVKDEIAKLLYSRTEGIGMRTYRYNIGAGSAQSGRGEYSDSARRTESFDAGDGKYDFTRDENAVYMMKKSVEYGADEVIFFVNSPIERLTKNGKAHLDKTAVFRTNLPKKNIGKFARYCLDVTEHFVKEGIPVKYVSPVNEPFWIWNGGQEGCHYKPRRASKVMLEFAREIKKRPSLAGVKLSGVENGDIRWLNKSYTYWLMKYKDVRDVIDGIDVHSYFLHEPLPFMNDRHAFMKRYRRWLDKHYPDVPLKMSEWCHMHGGRDCGMDSALETAKVMYEDISILNVSSWQHWIACSLYDYCDGLLYVYNDSETFEITKRYYVTGNFSKFIPYGAVRFEVRSDDNDVKLLGFEKNGKMVVIIINPSCEVKSFTLPYETAVYVTDKDSDLAEHRFASGEKITVTARSVNSVVIGGNV